MGKGRSEKKEMKVGEVKEGRHESRGVSAAIEDYSARLRVILCDLLVHEFHFGGASHLGSLAGGRLGIVRYQSHATYLYTYDAYLANTRI